MPDTLIGLDLGKSGDYTACSVLRRHLLKSPDGMPIRGGRQRALYGYTSRQIVRYKLGTSYPAIVDSVSELVKGPGMPHRPRLVIDATGVGSAVVDMFLHAGIQANVIPLTITGGSSWRTAAWETFPQVRAYWVAKTELVSALQAHLQLRRVWVDPKLDTAPLLKEELANFRVKISKAANETYEAREGEHDDLVLSIALPIWVGESRYTFFRDETIRAGDHPSAEVSAMRAEVDRDQEAREKQREADEKKRKDAWEHPMAEHWWRR